MVASVFIRSNGWICPIEGSGFEPKFEAWCAVVLDELLEYLDLPIIVISSVTLQDLFHRSAGLFQGVDVTFTTA